MCLISIVHWFFIIITATASLTGISCALAQSNIESELKASSQEHMREELGVNPITSPSIADLLKNLESFRPIPLKLIEPGSQDVSFTNRFQTALHFGALVADGFMLTIAERPQDVQKIGRDLIKESRALGVGDRLTKRSKSLLEYSDKGDWLGMRQELVKTQEDVEQSMMELRDEEMAHMISLGGWLRGFQIGATSAAEKYTPEKATILAQLDVMDYFLDRLDTLNPRLKKTEMVSAMIAAIKKIRLVIVDTQGAVPTADQVLKLKQFADEAEGIAVSHVNDEGRLPEKKKL